jgi:septum site-determining protein MinD
LTRILGIVSGKGGVGKSTVATNLAIALEKFKKNVILIDCNLSTPHLSHYFGIGDYHATINDVLLEKVDIYSALYNYDGVRIIPASVKIKDLVNIEVGNLKKHVEKLPSKKVDFIILDSAPGLGREALSVFNTSNELIFVTNPFVPMINDIIRCKEIAKGFGEKNMSIAVNMVNYGKNELTSKSIEKFSGMDVLGEIPFDRSVVNSLVLKMPVIEYRPNSLASISFMKLASLLVGKEYKTPMKFRLHKFAKKIKSLIFSEIIMPQETEELKEEFN